MVREAPYTLVQYPGLRKYPSLTARLSPYAFAVLDDIYVQTQFDDPVILGKGLEAYTYGLQMQAAQEPIVAARGLARSRLPLPLPRTRLNRADFQVLFTQVYRGYVDDLMQITEIENRSPEDVIEDSIVYFGLVAAYRAEGFSMLRPRGPRPEQGAILNLGRFFAAGYPPPQDTPPISML